MTRYEAKNENCSTDSLLFEGHSETMTDSIFVFGSNLRGIHGAGAALFAKQKYGAGWGVGVGPTGNSYALPTKKTPTEVLSLPEIQAYVKDFLLYARSLPSVKFQITRVGCGLAGYSDEEIAPFFDEAPSNCGFDPIWAKKFGYLSW